MPHLAARLPAGVALVAGQPLGPQLRPPPAGSLDRALVQQRRQDRLLVALPGRRDVGQRLAAALGPDVELGRVAALAAAEGLIAAPFLAPAACW